MQHQSARRSSGRTGSEEVPASAVLPRPATPTSLMTAASSSFNSGLPAGRRGGPYFFPTTRPTEDHQLFRPLSVSLARAAQHGNSRQVRIRVAFRYGSAQDSQWFHPAGDTRRVAPTSSMNCWPMPPTTGPVSIPIHISNSITSSTLFLGQRVEHADGEIEHRLGVIPAPAQEGRRQAHVGMADGLDLLDAA